MKRTIVLGLVSLLVAAFAMGQGAPGEEEEDEGKEIEMLGRNLRVDFKLVPLEGDDKGTFIVTAVSEYETSVSLEGDEGRMEFEVSGEVEIHDDGRIFVLYDVSIAFKGGEGKAKFYASSGVLLEPDKALELVRLGDKTLVLRVSYVDME